MNLYGRFMDKEFKLLVNEPEKKAVFSNEDFRMDIDWGTSEVLDAKLHHNNGEYTVDMVYYYAMRTLLKGMLNPSRVHFVNTGVVDQIKY